MSVIDFFHPKDFTMLRIYFVKCLVVSRCGILFRARALQAFHSEPSLRFDRFASLHIQLGPGQLRSWKLYELVGAWRWSPPARRRPCGQILDWRDFHVHQGRATLYAGSEGRYAENWMWQLCILFGMVTEKQKGYMSLRHRISSYQRDLPRTPPTATATSLRRIRTYMELVLLNRNYRLELKLHVLSRLLCFCMLSLGRCFDLKSSSIPAFCNGFEFS